MKTRIPIASPDLRLEEMDNLRIAMADSWISQGQFVERAQVLLCKITGRRYALCCSSGTTALVVALMATSGGGPVRTIATPALTFAAVHNAVRLAGARLQCLDADMLTWQPLNHDYRGVTWDTVISAPCYGSVHLPESLPHATRTFIEDASESFGGHVGDVWAGGDKRARISTLSFYANKIVTAGEGGAILTDDEELYKECRLIINHGIADKSYVPLRTGINGRMTDLQAAVLCAQLSRFSEMLARRYEIMQYYEAASRVEEWNLPGIASDEMPAPWVFAGVVKGGVPARQRIIQDCEQENIEWRPFFPIPPEGEHCGSARFLSGMGLCLPLSSAMTDAEVERVAEVIRG
jgi:perosamine synthetase